MAANPSSEHACACAPARRRAPRSGLASVASTVLLVLLPKCPYCLVAWMGVLGLGGYASHASMIPIAVLLAFCASQAAFFITTRRSGDRRSLVVAALGVAAVLGATLLDLPSFVRWSGVALLVLASILNAIATTRARAQGASSRRIPLFRSIQ